MRYITDLHIHSRFSRACSKNLTLSTLAAWARAKGIDVLGTSDFTHPAWLQEIEERLEPAEQGLFRLKKKFESEDGGDSYESAPLAHGARDIRFLLTTEVACIYKKNGRTRRLHLLVFMPSIQSVRNFVAALEAKKCNLRSDGRPILGLEAKEILRLAIEIDPKAMVVPAHAWTPWFSIFGSESGFDSLEECFEELTPHIHAIETGLSSDPAMNRRLSKLDQIALISNSDAHGVRNLGREANVFELGTLSYDAIMEAIKQRDVRRFLCTIEFFPEEGKYHVDGHRTCDFFCEPTETKRIGGLCPRCRKPLTRGVLGRVDVLADREASAQPRGFVPYRSIVPLEELIADALGKTKVAKAVYTHYQALLAKVGSEFHVLLDADPVQIAAAASTRIAEAVERMRAGKLIIRPGYDGVYGQVKIFEKKAELSAAQGRLLI